MDGKIHSFKSYFLIFNVTPLLLIVVHLRNGSDDPPILPRHAWSSHSHFGLLGTAFSVHIGATFLSICSSRKYDISHWCTDIAMVTWTVMAKSIEIECKIVSHF